MPREVVAFSYMLCFPSEKLLFSRENQENLNVLLMGENDARAVCVFEQNNGIFTHETVGEMNVGRANTFFFFF